MTTSPFPRPHALNIAQIICSRPPRTKDVLRIDLLRDTRQAAVILPAARTLEHPERVTVVVTAAIALLLLPDDARAQQVVAVRTTARIATCIADVKVAGITPLVPDIVGYG